MRRALVDNATLTAVQRLGGEIVVKNKYDLDGDILAMEGLLQAVLFFDEVCYVDDYKPDFRESRRDCFSGLTPLRLEDDAAAALSAQTLQQVQDVVPQITAGSFSDGDFAPFFRLLKMNLWYVWNMHSSVFYLTQKLLADASQVEIDKYSALSSMIYAELQDSMEGERIPRRAPSLVGSDGQPIDPDGENIPRQVSTFFAGLNWLAYRTVYYTILSNQLGCHLFLHPIRQAFQVNYMKKICPTAAPRFRPLIAALTKTAADAMERIYSPVNPHISSYPMPIFSAYIAAKSLRTGAGVLDVAWHLREEGPFVEARRRLDELERLYTEGKGKAFLRQANQLQKEVSAQMRRILEKYNVTTRQGSLVTDMVSLWDTSCLLTGLPRLEGPGAVHLATLAAGVRPRRGFAAVYKSILSDLTEIQMLGEFHDLITRQVRYDRDAQHYQIRLQNPAYKKAHSWWSNPM